MNQAVYLMVMGLSGAIGVALVFSPCVHSSFLFQKHLLFIKPLTSLA